MCLQIKLSYKKIVKLLRRVDPTKSLKELVSDEISCGLQMVTSPTDGTTEWVLPECVEKYSAMGVKALGCGESSTLIRVRSERRSQSSIQSSLSSKRNSSIEEITKWLERTMSSCEDNDTQLKI